MALTHHLDHTQRRHARRLGWSGLGSGKIRSEQISLVSEWREGDLGKDEERLNVHSRHVMPCYALAMCVQEYLLCVRAARIGILDRGEARERTRAIGELELGWLPWYTEYSSISSISIIG